jgi:hypothetical protein
MIKYLLDLFSSLFVVDPIHNEVSKIVEYNNKYNDYTDLCYPFNLETQLKKQIITHKSLEDISTQMKNYINEHNKYNDVWHIVYPNK